MVDDAKSRTDRELDETLEESFPASDAPANTVETGTRVGPPPSEEVAESGDGHKEASRKQTENDGTD